jgi:2-polyprenyl-3-methyl-5-hydroxy-6-metoxy-1,4-benzoquinol methylase
LVLTDYLLEAQQRMTHARNYLAWQSRLVTPELGPRVVEVGCGIGTFTGEMLDREAVLALDIDPECIERVRRHYPNRPNLRTLVCDAGSGGLSAFRDFRADSCVCLNVLEHIEDDRTALAGMASLLRPGGVVVLLVPAFQALFGPIDQNLGHFRRYRASLLAPLAAEAGLQVKKMRYLNSAGFFAWWASSKILKREFHSERQIECYDRYCIPWIERLENRFHPPFGQSLFAVLRKP